MWGWFFFFFFRYAILAVKHFSGIKALFCPLLDICRYWFNLSTMSLLQIPFFIPLFCLSLSFVKTNFLIITQGWCIQRLDWWLTSINADLLYILCFLPQSPQRSPWHRPMLMLKWVRMPGCNAPHHMTPLWTSPSSGPWTAESLTSTRTASTMNAPR